MRDMAAQAAPSGGRTTRLVTPAPPADPGADAGAESPVGSIVSCSRFFGGLALLSSRRPLLMIAASVLATAAAAVGMLLAPGGLVIDSDPDKIWVPPATLSARQEAFFDAAFDPFFRISQAIVSLADPADATTGSGGQPGDGGAAAGILQRGYLLSVLQLQQQLISTPAADGTLLDDVCYKPIAGKGCIIETPLDFFRSNATTVSLLTPPLLQDALACRHILGQTTIPCVSAIGVPVLPAVVLGGTSCPSAPIPGFNASACGGCGSAASAVMITFLLENTAADADRAANWERDVFLPLVAAFRAPGLRATYYAQRSISDELLVVEAQNEFVILISYLAMLAYIALALGKFPHPVATRALLGLQGVVIVGASVAAALGIAAWVGVHITMIVTEVVPFLILAIGVDNMFIISKAIDARWSGPTRGAAWRHLGPGAEPRLARGVDIEAAAISAMAEIGPTITAAAMCEVTAFGVGISTGVPALQQFCTVAAIAVAVDYVLQLSWFLPAVILDARRQEARRIDLLPCVQLRGGAVRTTRCALPTCCPREADGDGVENGDDGEVETAAAAQDEGLDAGFAPLSAPYSADDSSRGPGISDDVFSPDRKDRVASLGVAKPLFSSGSLNEPFLRLVSSTASTEASGSPRKAGGGDDGVEAGEGGAEVDDTDGGCCERGLSCWARVNRGGFVRACMARAYAPFLLAPATRVFVILLWLALINASFVGVQRLSLGLEQQLVLPAGSYLAPFFGDQARLGEAGPPAYLVLQNVNYTHPDTSTAIDSFVAAIGGLSRYIVAPVYSWVSDFENWGTPDTAAFVASNPGLACPTPLLAANFSFAARLAQYVFDIPIDSQCCQSAGYCGMQYSSDIKFLWGVPKPHERDHELETEGWREGGGSFAVSAGGAQRLAPFEGRVTAHVTKAGRALSLVSAPGRVYRSLSRTEAGVDIDDGGCDFDVGYLSPREADFAAAAVAATANAPPLSRRHFGARSSRIAVPAAALDIALPQRVLTRLRQRQKGRSRGLGLEGVELIPCHVMTSRLRTQHTPLRNQSDFIEGMLHVQSAVQSMQGSIPQADLALLGITGYGPLQPGSADLNTSEYPFAGDNEHTLWLPPASGDAAFAYSLFYVYYDQYSYVRGTVLTMLGLSLASVFGASTAVTASLVVGAITTSLVASIILTLVGFIWALNPQQAQDPNGAGPYGVDINAVSVVNLVTASGLGVEFVIHIVAAFVRASERARRRAVADAARTGAVSAAVGEGEVKVAGEVKGEGEGEVKGEVVAPRRCRVLPADTCSTRSGRAVHARAALVGTGSSVVTGITLTKLAGVLVLSMAPSQLFRLYYFRMYLGIVLLGAFHGLALLPVLLASFG